MDDRLKEIYQEILKNTPKHSPIVENMNETTTPSTTTSENSVKTTSKYFKIITVVLVIFISGYFMYKCFCTTDKTSTNHVRNNMREELIKPKENVVTDDDDYDDDDNDSIEDDIEETNDPLFQALE